MKNSRKVYNEEDYKKLIDAWENGNNINETAKILGTSKT
jgi:hypothetical protein